MRIPTILKRTRFLIVLLAAVWLTGTFGSAYADTFSFSYSFPVFALPLPDEGSPTEIGLVTASGTLVGTSLGGNLFQIIDITGTRDYEENGVEDISPINGLIDPGGFNFNDNLLDMSGTPFLTEGFSFTLLAGPGDDGAGNVNVYWDEAGYTEAFLRQVGDGTFTASDIGGDVPEPSSIVLLGLGLAGIAFRKFRR
jgi:hypothetical protein